MPSGFIATRAFRLTSSFLTLGLIFSNFISYAQTNTLERLFPIQGKSEIHILNAQKVTIRTWDRNEVKVLPESSGDPAEFAKLDTQLRDNKLDIKYPLLSEKNPPLILQVPANSVLELKIYSHKIEIKKPTGEVSMSATENELYFIAPKKADFTLREITRLVGLGTIGFFSGAGSLHIKGEQPQIKVIAKGANVHIHNPATEQAPGIFTVAAKKIANKDSLMSKALREEHPQLIASPSTSNESADSKNKENQEESLKLETYLVNLNVTVTDRNGKAITGLTKNDFSIYEEDALQNVTFFSPEKTPFNLVLLIDMSGSMRGKIKLIKEAALHFLEVIGPQDNLAVITFTTDVTVVSHLTNNREQLRESIRNLQPPVGGTAFYDALGYTLVEELSKVKGQRNAVIAITDGQDSGLVATLQIQQLMGLQQANARNGMPPIPQLGSYLTFKQLLDGVLEADALVYPVYLRTDAPAIPVMTKQTQTQIIQQSEQQLHELADASGGKLFAARQIEDLKEVYEQVAAELRTVYSLAYNPKDSSFNEKFRRIRVKVGTPGAAVRTRQGYYTK